jgi:stage V sporulation protein AA
MNLIQKHQPDIDIRHLGPNQIIVDIVGKAPKNRIFAVLFISILLFLGSGLAIMNFHADVSMQEVHERIYYLITGEKSTKPLILQIPYSIGIGVGMILFFNHLFKHRFNEEPSPVELEVFLYQESIDQYIINDEKQRLENHHDARQ